MTNEELEKMLTDINKKLEEFLENIYYGQDKFVETCGEPLVSIDGKSYEKICDYLDVDDITFMGLSQA